MTGAIRSRRPGYHLKMNCPLYLTNAELYKYSIQPFLWIYRLGYGYDP